MSKRALIAKNRDAILALAAKHGAADVRVFGSVARGDDTPESDVDVLVKLQNGRSLFDLGALLMDLRALLGCEVNVVSEHAALPAPFRANIAHEAQPV